MHMDATGLLQELGLTRSEARAYLTLLQAEEDLGLTGYEVSARSGVPRSAVYTVLGRLESLGACFVSGSRPARYLATDPQRFLQRLRVSFEALLEQTAEQLARVPKRTRPEPVWVRSGYDEVLHEADRLLRAATRSVLVSAWGRELDALRPALSACEQRDGLHRVLHCPDLGDRRIDGFSTWTDEVLAEPGKSGWSHRIIVVIDGAEALVGGAERAADNDCVRTSNRSLVDLATNHVILDITRIAAASGRPCEADVSPMMRTRLDGGTRGGHDGAEGPAAPR